MNSVMYAYIQLGNHQHKVEKGTVFHSERTSYKPNETFEIDQVIMLSEVPDSKNTSDPKETKGTAKNDKETQKKIHLGKPFLKDVKVEVQVITDLKAPKIQGFKYKKRKGYRKSWGHRQQLQKMKVLNIIKK